MWLLEPIWTARGVKEAVILLLDSLQPIFTNTARSDWAAEKIRTGWPCTHPTPRCSKTRHFTIWSIFTDIKNYLQTFKTVGGSIETISPINISALSSFSQCTGSSDGNSFYIFVGTGKDDPKTLFIDYWMILLSPGVNVWLCDRLVTLSECTPPSGNSS